MKKTIISISLGSSKRDMETEVWFNDNCFKIKRIGVNGSLKHFKNEMLLNIDKADVIAFGGIDIHFTLPDRRFLFKDAEKLLKLVETKPIVDGEAFKKWIEPYFFKQLFKEGAFPDNPKVLFPLAANRLSLVESMLEVGYKDLTFGDLVYDIGFPPIALRTLETYCRCGKFAGPLLTKLPFSWIYPTGEKQENRRVKRPELFERADIIAGDFHNIYRYLPNKMNGKTILTNTITENEVAVLKKSGVHSLITFSSSLNGRTFGANVMDGVITAYLEKGPNEIEENEYINAVRQLGITPEIRTLN